MPIETTLVADIGGTNARFAIADLKNGAFEIREVEYFRTEDFESARDAVEAYIGSKSINPTAACFAVAGPVVDQAIKFTNSRWVLNASEIRSAFEFEKCLVINDFHALASGLGHLGSNDMLPVKTGAHANDDAPQLIIGPGTGLGQALVVPCGNVRKVVPTEGGHVSFGPNNEIEFEVMKRVARKHARVSVERLLSGAGLVNIYRALCDISGKSGASLEASEITGAAQTGENRAAVEAVDMFCAILGSVAGDAALGTGARGGVVLAGGILPKIKDILQTSAFVDRFLDKGRMRAYLEDVPVSLIIRDGAALVGAAALIEGR